MLGRSAIGKKKISEHYNIYRKTQISHSTNKTMETPTHAPGNLESVPSLGYTVISWHTLLLLKSTVWVSVIQPSFVTTNSCVEQSWGAD
jgi:hypothetical protein